MEEQVNQLTKAQRRLPNKLGKKLLGMALDNFYAFKSDAVEDKLDLALIKFSGRAKWRSNVRSYLWSFPAIRAEICKEACYIYG